MNACEKALEAWVNIGEHRRNAVIVDLESEAQRLEEENRAEPKSADCALAARLLRMLVELQ